ncbi:Hypothetical_protein [Hexamita inflata]|uniref:Hypothetical_protein n=1 Tax=Hexamita inflata TaxID=28002 RepID=A0ABP1GH59_9EUKA
MIQLNDCLSKMCLERKWGGIQAASSQFQTMTVSNGSVERLFSFYHRQTCPFLGRNIDYTTLDQMANIYVEKIHIITFHENESDENESYDHNLSELHSSGTYNIYTKINFQVLIMYMFLKLMRHLRRIQINTWSKKTQPMTQKSYILRTIAQKTQGQCVFWVKKDAKTHLN